jgi:hypothetical protein
MNNYRKTSIIVGILIIVAYSMLSYDITKNVTLGIITDIMSGLAVISIALLMFPIFRTNQNKGMNYLYLICKFIEGTLMIAGGIFILNPIFVDYRAAIYKNIHIWFFIFGALVFYILLYRSQVIPKFVSIWGIIATVILFGVTIIKLSSPGLLILDVLLVPMVLNELFLAFWLIFKGFRIDIKEVQGGQYLTVRE